MPLWLVCKNKGGYVVTDQQGLIDSVELALDWGLPASKEELKKYREIVSNRTNDEEAGE